MKESHAIGQDIKIFEFWTKTAGSAVFARYLGAYNPDGSGGEGLSGAGGSLFINNLEVVNNATMDSNLEVRGVADLQDVTVRGNLIVTGNLTVQGDTTTVNTATLTIEDKNIVLASLESGTTDANANGGGMILKGATDHEFIWNQSLTTWDSTESINLANARSYKINGTTVLDANQCTVTSFPNLNQLGTLVDLTVDDVFINNYRISTTNGEDLEIEPDGSAISLIGSPIIKGLSTTADANPVQVTQHTGSITDPALQPNPALSATELSESTNKKYVLNFVRRRSLKEY
jgi:hypothetical protein